jgi:hypothetical protein
VSVESRNPVIGITSPTTWIPRARLRMRGC